MPLLLVHPSVDLTLELYVSSTLEEAIALQWERVRKHAVRDTYVKALEFRLEDLLRDCLDWDLKPPTAAQVSYATLLAARHGVSVPSEALNYRFHMAMFIEAWARKAEDGSHRAAKSGVISRYAHDVEVMKRTDSSSTDPEPSASKAP